MPTTMWRDLRRAAWGDLARVAIVALGSGALGCASSPRAHVQPSSEHLMDWEPHWVSASRKPGDTERAGLGEAAHEAVHRFCGARSKRAVIWDGRAGSSGGAELPRFTVHGGLSHYVEPTTAYYKATFRCESMAGVERPPPGTSMCAASVPRAWAFAVHVPQREQVWVFDGHGGHLEATLRSLAPGEGSVLPYRDAVRWGDRREHGHDATSLSGRWSVTSTTGGHFRVAFDDVVLLRDRGDRCATSLGRVEVTLAPEPWWSLPSCGLLHDAYPGSRFEWKYRTSEERTTFVPSFVDRGQEVVVDGPPSPGLRRVGRGVRFEATVGGRRMRAVDGALHIESSGADRYLLAAHAVVFVAEDEAPCVHVERAVTMRARADAAR